MSEQWVEQLFRKNEVQRTGLFSLIGSLSERDATQILDAIRESKNPTDEAFKGAIHNGTKRNH